MAEQIIGVANDCDQTQEPLTGWELITAGIRLVLPHISDAEARERAWAFIWRDLDRLDDDGKPLAAGVREFAMPRLDDLPECDDDEAAEVAEARVFPDHCDSAVGTLQ